MPQRKMSRIDIREISGVDFPAHGLEGWVIAKSADSLPIGAVELNEREQFIVKSLLGRIENGQTISFDEAGEGAKLGKTGSGTPFLVTPAAVQKAAGKEWAKAHNVAQRPSQRS